MTWRIRRTTRRCSSTPPPPFWDTNGDGNLTPADALLVINRLNSPQGGFQGEGEAQTLEVTTRREDVLGQVATWDDPQVSDLRDDHLLGTDRVVVPSYDLEPATEVPALDDAGFCQSTGSPSTNGSRSTSRPIIRTRKTNGSSCSGSNDRGPRSQSSLSVAHLETLIRLCPMLLPTEFADIMGVLSIEDML